eukprot:TRINITY_DN986_c0_g1_i2.p1 TRINITY_DN986_c0_g1~~TRINITY_DN986_c0_g1_i2.p1  ORF type:complete len:408 (-),score=95.83 TRINITY_DN986_c0_g1_i2:139-1296(-)
MEDVARFFSGSIPLGSHQTMAPSIPFNQIYIVGQKTHSEETINRNGVPKHLHVVVKNSPFNITIAMTNPSSCSTDLNRVAFEASLLYDEGGKEVDYVKSKPVEFKATPSENGHTMECELRIKVLTSHHEDLLFKVKIQGFDPSTKEELPAFNLMTFPLKVISKPEGLKKRAPNKKRSLTDMLVETVTRIEKKQEEQQRLIERVLSTQSMMPPPSSGSSSGMSNPNCNGNAEDSFKRQKVDELSFWENLMVTNTSTSSSSDGSNSKDEDKKELGNEFESSFAELIRAYNSMSPEEKPETIRKLIRNSSTRDTERLSELLDLFWTDGLVKERSGFGTARMPSNTVNHQHNTNGEGCSCQECPHKSELERIDQFYKEFLSSGFTLPGF